MESSTDTAPRRLPSSSTHAPPEPDAAAAPLLRLRLDDGRDVTLEGCVQIGSAPGNDLVLRDPFVSAVHCTIVRQSGRTLLKDMGSRNGCWLGAARVRHAELAAGTRLTLGGTTCEVVAAHEARHPLVGRSAALLRVRGELERVGRTTLPVLLLGESGTGKELAARAVHEASGRRGKLVAVNCGALLSSVVESELFGHERGAFTGASTRHPGYFEEADGGTLFFDEIGELPMTQQPKLLRALETGMVRAVGATSERRVNVRVVAATHRDVRAAIAAGLFRLDLYHRLSAFELRLPSLRERPEDILPLAHHFLDEVAGAGGPARSFSPAALAALMAHPWPGNVRELRNAVMRGAHLGGRLIEPEDLFPVRAASLVPPPVAPSDESGPHLTLEALQRQAIEHALRQTGSVRAAARRLGVPPSTLHDRVKRWGLVPGGGATAAED